MRLYLIIGLCALGLNLTSANYSTVIELAHVSIKYSFDFILWIQIIMNYNDFSLRMNMSLPI